MSGVCVCVTVCSLSLCVWPCLSHCLCVRLFVSLSVSLCVCLSLSLVVCVCVSSAGANSVHWILHIVGFSRPNSNLKHKAMRVHDQAHEADKSNARAWKASAESGAHTTPPPRPPLAVGGRSRDCQGLALPGSSTNARTAGSVARSVAFSHRSQVCRIGICQDSETLCPFETLLL